MTLRATRQYIDVLGPGAGKARITRQYIDVLGSAVAAVDADSTTTLTISSDSSVVASKLVSHSITITHNAAAEVVKLAASVLTLTQSSERLATFPRSISSNLNIVGSADVAYGKKVQANHALAISDSASVIKSHAYNCLAASTVTVSEVCGADYCRVGSSTITATSSASVELVKRISSSLTVTQLATTSNTLKRNSIQSIVATQTVDLQHVGRPANNILAITIWTDAVVSKGSTSTLAISQTADVTTNRLGAHTDLLTITQTSTCGFVKNLAARNTVIIDSQSQSGYLVAIAASALQEVQHNYDIYTGLDTPSYIGLSDLAEIIVIKAPKSAKSSLGVWQSATGIIIRPDAITCDANNTLTIGSTTYRNPGGSASDSLVLLQTASVETCQVATDTLTVEQLATQNIFRAVLSASSTINIDQEIAFVVPKNIYVNQYHPFGLPTTCPTPVAGIGACRFVYPVTHPTESLVVRSPEFGDIDRFSFNRISRETRGGTLLVYADPMWPKMQTKVLTINGLTSVQAQGYIDFIENHLGLEIGFVDWEGFYWKGIITNTTDPVVEDHRNLFTITVEFECEPTTWEP